MTNKSHLVLFMLCLSAWVMGAGSVVPVGENLYADMTQVADASGGLEIVFEKGAKGRVVIAYGWSNRKLRRDRAGTDEKTRQNFKPRLGKANEDGTVVRFEKLPRDFYDLVVIDTESMKMWEGLSLHHLSEEDGITEANTVAKASEEIMTCLEAKRNGITIWEGFFDTKQRERVELVEDQAGILLQQLRKGQALAESGDVLKGCIHSIDVVWVRRTLGIGNGWQVMNRQQLYRAELPTAEFFSSSYIKELNGVRIGTKVKKIHLPY